MLTRKVLHITQGSKWDGAGSSKWGGDGSKHDDLKWGQGDGCSRSSGDAVVGAMPVTPPAPSTPGKLEKDQWRARSNIAL